MKSEMDSSHRIHHQRFGELEIPESVVLHFDGLPGFDGIERLALLEHDRRAPLMWLLSLDDPRTHVGTHIDTMGIGRCRRHRAWAAPGWPAR